MRLNRFVMAVAAVTTLATAAGAFAQAQVQSEIYAVLTAEQKQEIAERRKEMEARRAEMTKRRQSAQ